MKYKAFISYSHSESGLRHAEALENALKNFPRPLLTPKLRIFRDKNHNVPDNYLSEQIKSGLNHSEFLIFLAEQKSAQSLWCQMELEYWCRDLDRRNRIIFVLIGGSIESVGTEAINWEMSSALPPLLKTYIEAIPLYVDMRKFSQPEDFGSHNSDYKDSALLILARLLKSTPSGLVSKDDQLYKQQLASLFLLVVLLILALIWAINSQREAKKQQQIAEKNLAAKIEEETQKERLNFDKYVSNGDVFANSGDFKIALRYFQKADSILLKFPKDSHLLGKKEALLQKINSAISKTHPK